jgi:hypothetical protein
MLKFLIHSFNSFKNVANNHLIKYGLVTNTIISVALRGLGDNIQQNIELSRTRFKTQTSNDNSLKEKRYDLNRTSKFEFFFWFFQTDYLSKKWFRYESEHFLIRISLRSIKLSLVQIFGHNSTKKNLQLNFEKDFARSDRGSHCFYISIHNDN